ncbi:MAG: Uma2 family endonuclease [Pseudonocardiaceae bacterium]
MPSWAAADRGAEGAELVVEISSKGDETYEKIDFYAELRVREMLIVHPDGRWVELLRAIGGRLLPVTKVPYSSRSW